PGWSPLPGRRPGQPGGRGPRDRARAVPPPHPARGNHGGGAGRAARERRGPRGIPQAGLGPRQRVCRPDGCAARRGGAAHAAPRGGRPPPDAGGTGAHPPRVRWRLRRDPHFRGRRGGAQSGSAGADQPVLISRSDRPPVPATGTRGSRRPHVPPRPAVVLFPGRDERLRAGHLWVYRTEIARIEGAPQDGDAVAVRTAFGHHLGVGFLNTRSVITVRILAAGDPPLDEAFFAGRLRSALALRGRPGWASSAGRLIYSEGDGLPGVIV